MEDMQTTLAGLEISDEAKEKILAAVKENYRTIAEVNDKAAKITALETKNAEAQKVIDSLKAADGTNTEELQKLKDQVAEFEQAKAAADAEKAKDEARAKFVDEFTAGIGDGKKFANSIVEKSIREAAYQMRKNNADMPIDAIMKQVIPDEEGVWANPQTDPKKMPAGSGAGAGSLESITSIDQVKKMTADEINANWDAVQKVLAQQQ